MKIATLLKSSTALSMVALLALSACGGGGRDSPTTTGGGAAAAPVDGDGMMPGDGDGDGMMPDDGDGDGMMPDDGDGDGMMPDDGDGDGMMPDDGDGDGMMPDDGDGDGPVVNDDPPINGPLPNVDLSRVTPGFMAGAGTVTIMAGESEVHGDIEFSCAAGGDGCVVMVRVGSGGTITATKTGGTVTAMNSDAYNTPIRVSNEANSIHAATGSDLVRGNDPLVVQWTIPSSSGSDYVGVWASATPPENTFGRSSRAILWVNSDGEVNFWFSFSSGLSATELDPLSWLGRSFDKSGISDYTEDTGHGLGGDWRVFDAKNEYAGAGTLTASVATDVHNAGPTEQPYVGYGDFARKIELSDEIPALPADRDWQGLNVVGGVKGSINGVPGEFTCDTGISACFLEIERNGDAEGYYPYENVVFTRDDNGAREEFSAATYGGPVPPADYLVFGTWQYVPEDITANDDYEFGAFAGGGDPFLSLDLAAKLNGTAKYNGSAHGMYYTGRSSKTPGVGSFDASVTLEADFGNLHTFDYGRLSGTVQSVRYDGAAPGFPAQLTLKEADIGSWLLFYPAMEQTMAAAGVVSDGQPTPAWGRRMAGDILR